MQISLDQKARFEAQGYLIVPDLLDGEEIQLLRNIALADRELSREAGRRDDGEGGAVRLVVRNDLPEDTIYGAIVRSRSVAGRMQELLEDEVYHYHHKMILKEARTGGAWAWHQDYGYWYDNGCLWPDMGSCMIAVDKATRANGCLQVVPGSHHLGRMEHVKIGQEGDQVSQQTGAAPERVAAVLERLPVVHVELEPGAGVFFHSNLLHRSDQNRDENPRWAFICCYNTRHNDPYKDSKHPRYTPMEQWDAERVRQIGRQQWQAMQQPS